MRWLAWHLLFGEWHLTLRKSRRRTFLAHMLLTQPEASTEALHLAGSLGPRSGARAVRQLADWGLITCFSRQRGHYIRLTRAAEDALLPVVVGHA